MNQWKVLEHNPVLKIKSHFLLLGQGIHTELEVVSESDLSWDTQKGNNKSFWEKHWGGIFEVELAQALGSHHYRGKKADRFFLTERQSWSFWFEKGKKRGVFSFRFLFMMLRLATLQWSDLHYLRRRTPLQQLWTKRNCYTTRQSYCPLSSEVQTNWCCFQFWSRTRELST